MAAKAETTMNDHYQRLSDLAQALQRDYFSVTDESRDPIYGAVVGFVRIALGRLCLLSSFPALFSSPNEDFSAEIRTKSLVAAIEIAEHHHALNDTPSYQPWRWVYQTQRHWHAVVFILIEICRRPWSPMIERAWLALQSPWLVPARGPIDKNFGVWVPLRKLMARARKHREDEISRLRAEPSVAVRVEEEARRQIPMPSSSITFPAYFQNEWFDERWRQLVRPIAATTMRPLEHIDHISATDRSTANLDVDPGSSAITEDIREMPWSTGPTQPAAADPEKSGTTSAARMSRPGEPTDSTGVTNLDTFLGTDMDMGFLDDMDAGDFLDFDWNSWLESTKGAL
ncbi:hypothetical protein LTR85_003704 [Meristemomyces frigidus]|nr:hypothetical protein LTR85_003704 [Meristemomyces frigidus]